MKTFVILSALLLSLSINAQAGIANTAFGDYAYNDNSTGTNNSAFGHRALDFNTSGDSNSAFGSNALKINQSGSNNSAFGVSALVDNSDGDFNSAFGIASLRSNQSGNFNDSFGVQSLFYNTFGSENSAIGSASLYWNVSGDYNVGVGRKSLYNIVDGNFNTAIGYNSLASGENAINQTVIGANAQGVSNNSVVIGNSEVTDIYMSQDSGATIYAGNATFNGDVVISSDKRLKANIVSLGATLSKLLQIDGKSYTMKKDESEKQKIGLLAQDIEKVFPELVSESNGIKSVNYQGLVPVLINALKEQQSEIDELKTMLKTLIEKT